MPNRIIRDWTDSYKVNQLTVHAERFFTRLIMKVDDYGRFYADPKLLKANLYPRLLESIREADISRWLTELENTKNEQGQKSGLVVIYETLGKRYLQIEDFKQTLRQKRQKHPPPELATHMHSNCIASACPEVETNPNPNPETNQETEVIFYRKFLHLKITNEEFEDLKKIGYTKQEIDSILDKIKNYRKNTKYSSLFLTAKNWLEKEKSFDKKENNGKGFDKNAASRAELDAAADEILRQQFDF